MDELVSIIVPCYNQAEYMDECLESVMNQTYDKWECIIVNDGSIDNTEEIALKWRERDNRFIYFKKENGGLSNTRNFGISNSHGKYILPLDCDDKIGKDYIRMGIKLMQKNRRIGVVYCKARLFGSKNKNWYLPPFDREYLLCKNMIFCSGIFYKDDWSKIGGYDEDLKYGYEDWEFWINLIHTLNKEVYQLNYTGFYYRQKHSSMILDLMQNKKRVADSFDIIFFKHKNLYDRYFPHKFVVYGNWWKKKNRKKRLKLKLTGIMNRFFRSISQKG